MCLKTIDNTSITMVRYLIKKTFPHHRILYTDSFKDKIVKMSVIKILTESRCPSITNVKDSSQIQNNNMSTSAKNPGSKQ